MTANAVPSFQWQCRLGATCQHPELPRVNGVCACDAKPAAVDTSAEAVERMAVNAKGWGWADSAAMLSALLADRDRLQRELDAARANERLTESHKSLLHDLAYIAHDGGLVSMSEHDALVAVRRLTLPYWCRVAAQNERIAFIRAAIAAQEGK